MNRGRVHLLGPPCYGDDELSPIFQYEVGPRSLYGSCLVQSSLSPATRDRYQLWVDQWCKFCERAAVAPLPVNPYALILWIELLVSSHAGSSVNVAFSAVIGWSKLNNYENPVNVNPVLESLRQGLRRTLLRRSVPQPPAITPDIVLQLFHRYWLLHHDSPEENIQYTRFVAMLLAAAELGPRPSEEINWNLCSYQRLPNSTGATLQFLDTKNNFHQRGPQARASIANSFLPLSTCPSAFTFLENIWLPLLRDLGISKHPDCDTTHESLHICRLCPALFATVLTNRPPGRVTRCHFADMFRRYLRAGQVPDAASYTPGSLRSGCASMAAERRVDRSTVHRHLRWSTGMQGAYTDTPAEDIPAVSRAIHHAYQRAPSGNTDSELYTSYNRSTTTSATFATCRACSSSATAHAAAAQPTQPAPVSTAARTATGSASLAAAAPRAPTCPNAQVAMNNWLGPQRCPLSTRARSARHNCRRRAPRLRRSRRRPRRACARPPPGARHCAP